MTATHVKKVQRMQQKGGKESSANKDKQEHQFTTNQINWLQVSNMIDDQIISAKD